MDFDRIFTTDGVVYTSTVASHWTGNEWCVKLSKLSGFIKRGIHQKQSLTRIVNVWLGWSFIQNFMKTPVEYHVIHNM